MDFFTGWQYLLIDCANNFGKDKLVFEDRIQWATDNLDHLEELAVGEEWKDKPLYLKAVGAIRKAQAGKPTGHMVGFDSVNSGMQIMSTLTGCIAGATATGLIDPNKRADAYTECTDIMSRILGVLMTHDRDDVKASCMTVLYGSKNEPKKMFGKDTPELQAFYQAMWQLAPGACELLQDLIDSWQPFALAHECVSPDGFHAKNKVMQKVEGVRIEVDELDHATFTYEYYINEGSESGLSNVANMIQQGDAYVLRCLVRRCNYDPELIQWASHHIDAILLERHTGFSIQSSDDWLNDDFLRLRNRYEASQMPDIRILNYAQEWELRAMTTAHLKGLAGIINRMLEHKPFPVIPIHDDYKSHANNMNHLRQHYIDIFAEMADSTMLDDILSQLHGTPGIFPKKSTNLAAKIRGCNYALS